MWLQTAQPFQSMALSVAMALVPPTLLLLLTTVGRVSVLRSTLMAMTVTLLVVCVVWRMPIHLAILSLIQGALLGATGIGWVIMAGLFTVQVLRETGDLDTLCSDLVRISPTRGFQALLIGFCLNGFLESISGYGVPILTVALLLRALDWTWPEAAVAALLGNSLTVAFGALGTPITTIGGLTHLNGSVISITAALLLLPLVPMGLALFVRLTGGSDGFRQEGSRSVRTGIAYGVAQTLTALLGAGELAGVAGALAATLFLVLDSRASWRAPLQTRRAYWSPLLMIVGLLLLSKVPMVQSWLVKATWKPVIPGLDGQIIRAESGPVPAIVDLSLLAHPGTAVLIAALITGLLLRRKPGILWTAAKGTWSQAKLNLSSTVGILAIAALMTNAGLAGTIGLALRSTGVVLPLLAPWIGWLGGMLTGSATSANALFGPAQVAAAQAGGLNSYLIAAANTVGGSLAKMASPLSLGLLDGLARQGPGPSPIPGRQLLVNSIRLVALLSPLVLLCTFFAYRMDFP